VIKYNKDRAILHKEQTKTLSAIAP